MLSCLPRRRNRWVTERLKSWPETRLAMRHAARHYWGQPTTEPQSRLPASPRPGVSASHPRMLPCSLPHTMPLTRVKGQLMSASEIDCTLVRLAHEILEKNSDLDRLAFIGIRRRGVPLAQRLRRKSRSIEGPCRRVISPNRARSAGASSSANCSFTSLSRPNRSVMPASGPS